MRWRMVGEKLGKPGRGSRHKNNVITRQRVGRKSTKRPMPAALTVPQSAKEMETELQDRDGNRGAGRGWEIGPPMAAAKVAAGTEQEQEQKPKESFMTIMTSPV